MKKYLSIMLIVTIAFPSLVMAQALFGAATSTDAGGDTSTSTPTTDLSVATSTMATTTTAGPDATTTAATTTAPGQTATTPATSTPAEGLQVGSATAVAIDDIMGAENNYYAEHKDYLPILPGNKLLPKEQGTVTEKFGHEIPADARVDVHDSPRGKGYRVVYTLGNKFYSVGYGPDAASFTYSYDLSPAPGTASSSTATSTTAASTNSTNPTSATSANSVVPRTDSTGSSTAPAISDTSTTTPTTLPEASTTPITLPDASEAASSSATSTQ